MREIYLTYLKWAESAGLDAETRLAGLKLMIEAEEDPYRSRLEIPRRPVDEVAERRRAYDRERKRKSGGSSGGTPVETPPPSPPSSLSPTPPILTTLSSPSLKKQEAREKEGKVSVDRWSLSEEILDYGRDLGLSGDEVREKAEDMRLWARGKDIRRTLRGWDATLQMILRKLAKELNANVQASKSKLSGAARAFERMQNLTTGGFFEDRGNVVVLPQIGRCGHGETGGTGNGGDGISPRSSPVGHSSDNGVIDGAGLVPDRQAIPGSLRAADGSPAADGARKTDTS